MKNHLRETFRSAAMIASLAVMTVSAGAQSASTGAVQGTVTDPSHAAIPGAKITLLNPGTGAVLTAQSGARGGYTVPSILPGTYSMTVTATGFKSYHLTNLPVTVNKTALVNVEMQIGTQQQTVEVTASAVQLQTASATVGNTVNSQSLLLLPTLHRDSAELLNYQPATVAQGPQTRVAGAVDDQNTFTLDGIDISAMDPSNVDNTTGIPVPVASVQEFRVGVSNNNASMNMGSGGQVALIGKSGTNEFHGSLYADLEDSKLNANTWDDNHTPSRVGSTSLPYTPRPSVIDKRFGAAVGGPIIKDRTFFFVNYEPRRFSESVDTHSLVPTDSLKQGILSFADASGNMISYPLATSTQCGPSGTSACDPRGLGLSPTMAAMYTMYPEPNDFAEGDGINYAGFDASVATPEIADFITARIDQVLTQKWRFNADYAYSRDKKVSNGLGGLGAQLDIINGNVKELRQTPLRHDMMAASLIGQLSPNVINAFHFGFVRLRTRRAPDVPSVWAAIEALPGTDTPNNGWIALEPSNLYSQLIGNAPFQQETDRSTQLVDTVDWIKGSHSFEFGGNLNHMNSIEVRNNQLGASSSITATGHASSFLRIPSSDQPMPCSATVTTGCLPGSDLSTWNSLYSSTLGMVDNVGVMDVRDAQLNAYPLGTNLTANNTMDFVFLYGQDAWKLSRSLTVTYGLSWGKQTVPNELKGRQAVMIDTSTGQPVSAVSYMNAKLAAAEAGQFYNPTFGFVPEKNAPSKSLFTNNPAYWSPRVGLAWNPSFRGGVLRRLFGDQKSVLRGGFGVVHDRTNAVKTTTLPALGLGFADTPTVITPACDISGAPGTGCSSGSTDPALSSFRVGVDGQMPIPPVVPSETSPIIPAQNLSALATFQLDPNNIMGYAYNADLNLERELPHGMIFSLGWIGHYGRDLPQAFDLTSAPYMFKDTTSGQTFAQAYDAIANALNTGGTVPDEAWFDNLVPAQTVNGSTVNGSAYMSSNFASLFETAQVREIFNTMDSLRVAAGLPAFDNQQIDVVQMYTHVGRSNYNAFTATLNKQTSNGLTMAINYTWSHELDDQISDQNNAGYYNNNYYIGQNYGAGFADARNVLNATFVYQLPFGRSLFATSGWTNKLLTGWYTSGIVTAQQGFPVTVSMVGQVYGASPILGSGIAAIPTVSPSSMGAGVHNIGGKGTGLNLFADPSKVFSEFRNVNLTTDGLNGAANPITGLPLMNFDFGAGKRTQIFERFSLTYSAQFFNLFNNVNFVTPSLSLGSPANFGAITRQLIPTNRQSGSRWIEMELRLDF
ncbi:MAG TPA: carboxypeptidase-like regulatory domain-containing protein [Candidatus Sulfotelmatobacter sp.]|nr:carboxypeptidase-like regulatory domain-containing protein [Candidatus Sulfotelmatobacter sp.]